MTQEDEKKIKSTRYRVREAKATDYTPDTANANRGSRRGQRQIAASYKRAGAGRSWLVDKDGQLIAGNHAQQGAIEAGVEDVVEIEVLDPHVQVVVKRPDLDLDGEDDAARMLAWADNRSGQLSLEWDPEMVAADAQMLVDEGLFRDDEIEALLLQGEAEALVDDAMSAPRQERASLNANKAQIKPVLYTDQLEVFERAILMARPVAGRQRAKCLAHICQFFIDNHTDADLEGMLNGEEGE
jgi:hypothetical protein